MKPADEESKSTLNLILILELHRRGAKAQLQETPLKDNGTN